MSDQSESIVVAAGCFWCIESIFQELRGVISVESGYAGGRRAGVSYEEVCGGDSGHAEVVTITYDPTVVSGDDLLRLFFTLHDPTTLNRQGPDVGTQYRSAIFYSTEEERLRAERIRDEIAAAGVWPDPIVTTIEPLTNYTRAEDYHQGYFARYETAGFIERLGMNSGYCANVVEPKVQKFRKVFAERLK